MIAYVNYMAGMIVNGAGDFKPDYNGIIVLAGDAAALVSEVDILLGSQLGAATRQTIAAAVDATSFAAANGPLNRVYTAILLTLASPDYLVQK